MNIKICLILSKIQYQIVKVYIEQGVALTGRDTTGPLSCCTLVSYVAYWSVTYDDRCQTTDNKRRRQTPESKTILAPYTVCRRASNNVFAAERNWSTYDFIHNMKRKQAYWRQGQRFGLRSFEPASAGEHSSCELCWNNCWVGATGCFWFWLRITLIWVWLVAVECFCDCKEMWLYFFQSKAKFWISNKIQWAFLKFSKIHFFKY